MSKYGDISAADLIESLGREKEIACSRRQYFCQLALWLVSIIAVPAVVFVPVLRIPVTVGLFVLTAAMAGWTRLFGGGFRFRLEKPEDLLDWACTIVFYLSAIIFALGFIVSVTSGGTPKTVDGAYAIVSGSRIIREIDEASYNFYSSARGAMVSILTAFNCAQFSFIRKHTPW